MRVICVFVMVLSFGCASHNWGKDIVWGNGMIGEDCQVYGDSVECDSVLKGAHLGDVAGDVIGKVIDTLVGFIPRGSNAGSSDNTLDITIREDTRK